MEGLFLPLFRDGRLFFFGCSCLIQNRRFLRRRFRQARCRNILFLQSGKRLCVCWLLLFAFFRRTGGIQHKLFRPLLPFGAQRQKSFRRHAKYRLFRFLFFSRRFF